MRESYNLSSNLDKLQTFDNVVIKFELAVNLASSCVI